MRDGEDERKPAAHLLSAVRGFEFSASSNSTLDFPRTGRRACVLNMDVCVS